MTEVESPITGGICQVPGCARLGRKSQDVLRQVLRQAKGAAARGDVLLCDEHYEESETDVDGFRRKHFPDFG
jgi:hypothetical protein